MLPIQRFLRGDGRRPSPHLPSCQRCVLRRMLRGGAGIVVRLVGDVALDDFTVVEADKRRVVIAATYSCDHAAKFLDHASRTKVLAGKRTCEHGNMTTNADRHGFLQAGKRYRSTTDRP